MGVLQHYSQLTPQPRVESADYTLTNYDETGPRQQVFLGRVRSSKKRLSQLTPNHASNPVPVIDRSRLPLIPYRTTVRPDTRFTSCRTHAHNAGTTPPGVHPTSTSRDVSDQAFRSLSNFYCVLRCACGGRPGNEARPSLSRA